jgi:chromosome segregation ATPase
VIEQAMIFTLGFLVAGLLMLLFLPAYGRRAMRLSRRRLEMQMPLSMEEIVAERDQLRAEFAAEHRRIEQRAETVETQNAHNLGELGRRSALISAMDAELAESKREALELHRRIGEAARETREAQGELAMVIKDLYDTSGLLDRRNATLAALERRHGDLGDLAEERRATIAALETRAAGLDMRIADLQRELESARQALAERSAAVERVTRERDNVRADYAGVEAQRLSLAERLAREQQKLQEVEDELRRERDELARSLDSSEEKRREVVAAEERAKVLRASLERQTESLKSHERDFDRRLEDLRAQNGVLKSALETARREYQEMRLQLASLQAGRPNYDAAVDPDEAPILRRAISDIGAEVLRLATALEKQGGADAGSLADRVRELQDEAARGG